MRWLPYKTAKAVLLLLFKRATRRVAGQTEEVAKLSNARIETATEQLNQVADEIRDAPAELEEAALPVYRQARANTALPDKIRTLRRK